MLVVKVFPQKKMHGHIFAIGAMIFLAFHLAVSISTTRPILMMIFARLVLRSGSIQILHFRVHVSKSGKHE